MVMGPEDLVKKIIQENAEKIKQLETKIDDILKSKYDGYCLVSISGDLFNDLKLCCRDELLSRYKAAGWDIEHVDNQRDGNNYYFTRKKD